MNGTREVAKPDANTAIRFLHTCFDHDHWVALFLKNYADGHVAQHVGPVSWVASRGVQRWLVEMNRLGFNVYVSLSTIAPGRRIRTRDAVVRVRHVFADADREGRTVLATIAGRCDLPEPSYVLHTSPGRLHVLWRVNGFDAALAERLQKQLARELQTDPAATAITQVTRLPGFLYLKSPMWWMRGFVLLRPSRIYAAVTRIDDHTAASVCVPLCLCSSDARSVEPRVIVDELPTGRHAATSKHVRAG